MSTPMTEQDGRRIHLYRLYNSTVKKSAAPCLPFVTTPSEERSGLVFFQRLISSSETFINMKNMLAISHTD